MSTIRLPAIQESLDPLIGFVAGKAEQKGFPAMRINEIELALEEALVNILTYAYGKKGEGEVQITCTCPEDATLVVEIMDNGTPFDPLSLPVPDLLADLAVREIGGLGVFLVSQMTDEVRYRREGGANILTLTFSK